MIEVKDVRKTFKLSRQQRREMGEEFTGTTIDAVAGISFTCQPGRIFTLLGPNGAGKTTTLRMIATMLKPSSGSISVAGHDVVSSGRDVRR
ncbi:MAG TPA: ATP-binding cassette domain-containing protein, partial [Bacteroidetes bacterium]|nr:ATP-binding cassette domain-containing protein [Bacteroidota bacterium]